MKEKYDEILNLPHYEPKHPRMSIENSSAQFAPFSALTGYEDLVKESGRFTESEKELNEDEKEILDRKLSLIYEKLNLGEVFNVKVKYFEKDLRKSGGKYKEYIGRVRRIDRYKQIIIFEDETRLMIHDINDIDIEIE